MPIEELSEIGDLMIGDLVKTYERGLHWVKR